MKRRVVIDTTVVLSQLTPDPRGGTLWHWIRTGVVFPVLSQYLIDELIEKLALPKFTLTLATQTEIVAEYLQFAEFLVDVPPSGVQCRDPDDVPILDLALAANVDALVTGDRDLLDMDGEFNFPIVRPGRLGQMLSDLCR